MTSEMLWELGFTALGTFLPIVQAPEEGLSLGLWSLAFLRACWAVHMAQQQTHKLAFWCRKQLGLSQNGYFNKAL